MSFFVSKYLLCLCPAERATINLIYTNCDFKGQQKSSPIAKSDKGICLPSVVRFSEVIALPNQNMILSSPPSCLVPLTSLGWQCLTQGVTELQQQQNRKLVIQRYQNYCKILPCTKTVPNSQKEENRWKQNHTSFEKKKNWILSGAADSPGASIPRSEDPIPSDAFLQTHENEVPLSSGWISLDLGTSEMIRCKWLFNSKWLLLPSCTSVLQHTGTVCANTVCTSGIHSVHLKALPLPQSDCSSH